MAGIAHATPDNIGMKLLPLRPKNRRGLWQINAAREITGVLQQTNDKRQDKYLWHKHKKSANTAKNGISDKVSKDAARNRGQQPTT